MDILRNGEVQFEGRRILFRNFSGAKGKFNEEGNRNFGVLLTDEEHDRLKEMGWNPKYLRSRDEYEEPQAWIKVNVKFGTKGPDPRVVLITSKGKTPLTEDMLILLDWADIENVDLILRPYSWEMRGNKGISAYLKSIYVTIHEDPLELKYADVPDSALGALTMNAQSEEPGVIHVASEQIAITRGGEDKPPF